MSANETVHVSATGGQKAGNDERYDLIPAEPLRRLAIHAGARVINGNPGSFARMMDHAWLFWAGEEDDTACDWPHLIAAAWEAFKIVDPKAPHGVWYGNDGLPRYDQIPADALRQLARHFGVGAKKYDDDNWTRGYDWRLTFAAANRHAEQFRAGESHDPETGSHHLIAFAWHMLVLDEFTRINRGGDTRYATKVRAWRDAEQLWRHVNTAPSPFGPDAAQISTTVKLWLPGDPRVVERLTIHEADGTEWRDNAGDFYRWHGDGWQFRGRCAEEWEALIEVCLITDFAPYTEVVQPRVVDKLGDGERDTEWTGTAGHYRYDAEYMRWTRRPVGYRAWHPTVCTDPGFGPYTEHTGDDE